MKIDFELFGGRRAFVEHIFARGLAVIGAYSNHGGFDWASVERLVFVCKGNICRSPYAEMKARSLGLLSASCGLEAVDGAFANRDAQRNAAARGIDLSAHLSRRFLPEDVRGNDLLLFFEPRQAAGAARVARGIQTSLVGLWSESCRPYIADPYGRSDRYFQVCFGLIDSSLQVIASKMSDTRQSL